jgi:hypothetical protein
VDGRGARSSQLYQAKISITYWDPMPREEPKITKMRWDPVQPVEGNNSRLDSKPARAMHHTGLVGSEYGAHAVR